MQPEQEQVILTRSFKSISPVTNKIIAQLPFINDEEVTKKIQRSWQAYENYREVDIQARCEKFLRLATLMEENIQKFAEIITQEMGKPIKQSIGEVQFSANQLRYYVKNSAEFLKPKVIAASNKECSVEYFPIGPIYIIVPFNNPWRLSFLSITPSLLIGNTILYRPADSLPLMGKAIEGLMIEAGFDNGEFQAIYSAPEQLEMILAHKHVRGVSFTGSTFSGKRIAAMASKHAKKAVMELGGSDPFMVLEDANVDKAVDAAIDSRLTNCGQVCSAGKRFMIHDKVYDEFKQKLVEKVSKLKIGLPMNPDTFLGPLARPDLRAGIEKQVQEANEEGSKLLYGGKRPEGEELQSGNFYMPTIFEVDSKESVLFREETFGPVFPLLKVSSEEEMVKISNDSEYGLGCVIMSENIERAKKIARKIESGVIAINAKVFPDVATPYGGVKGSGFGRQYGEYGLHEFANIKATSITQ